MVAILFANAPAQIETLQDPRLTSAPWHCEDRSALVYRFYSAPSLQPGTALPVERTKPAVTHETAAVPHQHAYLAKLLGQSDTQWHHFLLDAPIPRTDCEQSHHVGQAMKKCVSTTIYGSRGGYQD